MPGVNERMKQVGSREIQALLIISDPIAAANIIAKSRKALKRTVERLCDALESEEIKPEELAKIAASLAKVQMAMASGARAALSNVDEREMLRSIQEQAQKLEKAHRNFAAMVAKRERTIDVTPNGAIEEAAENGRLEP